MPDIVTIEAWRRITEIVESQDRQKLTDYLDTLAPAELARALGKLDDQTRTGVLILLEPEDAADIIEELHESQGADLLEELPAGKAAAILDEIDSDQRVDIMHELDKIDLEAILKEMNPEEAEDARALLGYEKTTAGGLMITEYLAYRENLTIDDVLSDLRANAEKYSDYAVQYVYVISETGVLDGVVRLRDLVLSPGYTPLSAIAILNPFKVKDTDSLHSLAQFFSRNVFFGVPVVDSDGKLVGVVQRADVQKASSEAAMNTFQRFAGIIGGDELRSMPVKLRSSRRLAFLSVNIVLNLISASVIAMYEDTLQAVIALAVFLPILSDMSGCSGNQAVAVSIRELSLGLAQPRDFLRVWWKEAQVGVINGIVLGAMLCGVAYIWKGSIVLAAVVGLALAANTLLSVCLGGLIPLTIQRVGIDPALAASPILTTFTDMLGFFLALSFAAICLSSGWL
ncbi:MAG TPA: magnesium transporter [Candidatus Hydrogenedentes bacterium]|nr:magnesium transporter [Candidatus Hydrogenedentota bacterium]